MKNTEKTVTFHWFASDFLMIILALLSSPPFLNGRDSFCCDVIAWSRAIIVRATTTCPHHA